MGAIIKDSVVTWVVLMRNISEVEGSHERLFDPVSLQHRNRPFRT